MSGLEGAGGGTSEVPSEGDTPKRAQEAPGIQLQVGLRVQTRGRAVSLLRLHLTLQCPQNAHKTTWTGVLLLSEMPKT